jgi:Thrombospondin type 3 repeat
MAGCNGLLGLDPTVDESRDIDRDGVIDTLDNCPGLENRDQLDTDGDGIGDACDHCPMGLACNVAGAVPTGIDHDSNCIDDGCEDCRLLTTADEDGDGVPDGCDLCPAFADPDQPDADGDGIGDRCDLGAPRIQARLLFDGFNNTNGKLDEMQWIPGPDWDVATGAARTLGSSPLKLLRTLNGGGAFGDWSILVGIVATDVSTEPKNDVSITVKNDLGNATCSLRYIVPQFSLAAQWEITASGSDQSEASTHGEAQVIPVIPFRMALAQRQSGFGFRCEIATDVTPLVPSPFSGPSLSSGPLEVSISATKPTGFTYALVID